MILGVYMMNIYGIKRKDLEDYFISNGEKKFKALQVFEWIYEKRINTFDEMSNISKDVREKISNDFNMNMIKIIKKQEDDLTKKYLFELEDKNHIEAVLMEHDYGISICVSSEVGCNMGCRFCESGRLKRVRNLEAYEMVEQILLIEKDIKKRISSVVIMGIGEPLDNYDNVMDFIKIINDPKGIAIGARHITLSTCGIIPKIMELADEPIQINLAISLHAPNDKLRSSIMPINKAYGIQRLMVAINKYIEKTNRRVTIEYVMLDNVNDSIKCANELSKLLKGMLVYVNLIPYNETNHLEFKRTSKEKVMQFYDILKKNGINVTIRKEFGSNIDAACGQLRSKEVEL
ncbi:MAG: 23S rRNA (adenine(2503)-C(2))-methyltransferase RlmN [Bacilli bacterium]|nr:23S rRNA (adenine(2503)-C(2))-methyltransferase RlmN [Bacilli bacterium]